jgi:hypothetical protein
MTPAQVKATYRRMLDDRGETVVIRRYGAGIAGTSRPRFDVEVMAVVTGYAHNELVGPLQQGDRRMIVLVEDLLERQFALPITAADKAIVRGRECAILAPDDSTRRVAGTLIAYELTVRG